MKIVKENIKISMFILASSVAAALLFSKLLSIGFSRPFPDLLAGTLVVVGIISLCTMPVIYFIGHLLKGRPVRYSVLFVNLQVIATASLGWFVSLVLMKHALVGEDAVFADEVLRAMYLPIVVFCVLVTTAAKYYDRMRFRYQTLVEDAETVKRPVPAGPISSEGGLMLRESDLVSREVKFEDIVYISSHGKKSVLHTVQRDHTAAMTLKTIEAMIPTGLFVRIHKQFIINRLYLKSVKCRSGGYYMAYLKDPDDSMLPVGRKYLRSIRS